MLQVDERFMLVDLDYLKKEVERTDSMQSDLLKVLIDNAISEIEMHRKFNKFNKDYSDYLRFINYGKMVY